MLLRGNVLVEGDKLVAKPGIGQFVEARAVRRGAEARGARAGVTLEDAAGVGAAMTRRPLEVLVLALGDGVVGAVAAWAALQHGEHRDVLVHFFAYLAVLGLFKARDAARRIPALGPPREPTRVTVCYEARGGYSWRGCSSATTPGRARSASGSS